MGRMLLWEGLQSRRSNVPGGFGLHSSRLKPLPQVPPQGSPEDCTVWGISVRRRKVPSGFGLHSSRLKPLPQVRCQDRLRAALWEGLQSRRRTVSADLPLVAADAAPTSVPPGSPEDCTVWRISVRCRKVPGGFGLPSLRLKPLPQVRCQDRLRAALWEGLCPTQESAKWLWASLVAAEAAPTSAVPGSLEGCTVGGTSVPTTDGVSRPSARRR